MEYDPKNDPRLSDPLKEITRKERRYLLGVSVLGIAIVKAGIVPTKLTTFGVEFEKVNQQWLLLVLGFVILYFLIAFIIYSTSDFIVWRLTFISIYKRRLKALIRRKETIASEISETEELIEELKKRLIDTEYTSPILESHDYQKKNARFSDPYNIKSVIKLVEPISITRATFEFLLPLCVGIYTVILVLSASFSESS